MDYSEIQPEVQLEIKNALDKYTNDKKYTVANVPIHFHTGKDSSQINYSDLENKTRFVYCRIVDPITDVAVANVVGGDFVMPFGGYITLVVATVDTAGTTGTMTIDVNKNGSTIMTTKVTIDTTEKTSRSGATQSILDSSKVNFVVGDIITFDIDGIQTTPAKGLSMCLNVVQTTP